jgi:hypothetical protein
MSAVLYRMINDKAEKDWTGPEITAATISVWAEHWFKVAEQIAIEFDNDRLLPATAKAVRDIVTEQKRFYK